MQEDFFLLGTISQNKNKIEIVPPGLLHSGTNLYQNVQFLLKIFDALEWARSKVQDFVSLWTVFGFRGQVQKAKKFEKPQIQGSI